MLRLSRKKNNKNSRKARSGKDNGLARKIYKTITPGADELLFLPLGGCNEIGMNLNLYGHAGCWLMVDCGVSFADGRTTGIDVLLPNVSFVAAHKDMLCGLVLTHAHEDHLGAVAHLWEEFQCPIYATPFTMEVLKHKLTEAGLMGKVPLHSISMSERFQLGEFDIQMISLTHSIPEPNALIIRTSAGNIMHSGDWKLDDTPVVGENTDEKALKQAGEEGILAMLCDSTNVFYPGASLSEGEIGDNLKSFIATLSGRVIITCFASNVARLQSIFSAAEATGRSVFLAGKAMHRMLAYAQATGYLSLDLQFHDAYLEQPHANSIILCTGSQGEPLAALSRIARREHRIIKPQAGDSMIFSARVIPGNELAIANLQNMLVSQGVRLIDPEGQGVYGAFHASGHPHQQELATMYQWIKPHIAIPVHGEQRHLHAHCELAMACQVSHSAVAENGLVLGLSKEGVERIGYVDHAVMCLDSNRIVPWHSANLAERRKLAVEGILFCSLIVSNGKLVSKPRISIKGIACNGEFDGVGGEEDMTLFANCADSAFNQLDRDSRLDGAVVCETVRVHLRRQARRLYAKNTIVEVHFSNL